MQRFIRFKEYPPGTDRTFALTEQHHLEGDETMCSQTMTLATDENGFIVNGNGFREGDLVVCAGDSVMECYNLPATSRVCSVLERLLNTRGRRAIVGNAAYSGATLLHAINVILNKVVAIRPKILIVAVGSIDREACRFSGGFWSSNRYLSPLTAATGDLPEQPEQVLPWRFEDRTALLWVLREISARFGAKLFLTTVAHKTLDDPWSRKNKDAKGLDREVAIYADMNESTRAFCRESGCECIDFAKEMRSMDGMFYDIVHFNERGAALAAAIIDRHISPFMS